MRILYYQDNTKTGFGRYYVVTGKAAGAVKSLTGRESLTPKIMAALKDLGHTLQEVSMPQHGR